MPRTDTDPLGDGLKWRLRAELNRVQPPYSSPRYLVSARHRVAVWRVAPAALAAAIVGMLGLTAYAATGSPNPVVWTQQIMTRIQPNSAPESTPATPGFTPTSRAVPPAPAPPTHEAEPTEQPEPSEEPQASPSPEHDSGGSGGSDDSHSTQASPSPGAYGGDH
ncbi:MAG TPA: hypothetical protein VFL27_06180 [Candidatus Dormibacteraeota bacterium]|nr:hypothetical protein [Candidatus Dormibacteraeota bacterium]